MVSYLTLDQQLQVVFPALLGMLCSYHARATHRSCHFLGFNCPPRCVGEIAIDLELSDNRIFPLCCKFREHPFSPCNQDLNSIDMYPFDMHRSYHWDGSPFLAGLLRRNGTAQAFARQKVQHFHPRLLFADLPR